MRRRGLQTWMQQQRSCGQPQRLICAGCCPRPSPTCRRCRSYSCCCGQRSHQSSSREHSRMHRIGHRIGQHHSRAASRAGRWWYCSAAGEMGAAEDADGDDQEAGDQLNNGCFQSRSTQGVVDVTECGQCQSRARLCKLAQHVRNGDRARHGHGSHSLSGMGISMGSGPAAGSSHGLSVGQTCWRQRMCTAWIAVGRRYQSTM
jgi:hypothetical protein